MKTYIEQLRGRPDHHKRRIAFGLATFFTGLIFVVWLSVLLPQGSAVTVAKNESLKKVTAESPFSTFKNGVAQSYEALKESISDTKKSVDLEAEYNRMKGQVESGQIKITPVSTEQ
jgi:hypothetical protein